MNGQTDGVALSLLELLIAATNAEHGSQKFVQITEDFWLIITPLVILLI